MFKVLKMTGYFENMILKRRPEFISREKDILAWISHPSEIHVQEDGRKKLFAIDNQNGKWVRIILEQDSIHNIFYDRSHKGS